MNQTVLTSESESSYWLAVARLVSGLVHRAPSGQSSLLKVDGLRDNGKFYTVMLDGSIEEGPKFRKNGGDLRALLAEVVVESSAAVHDLASKDDVSLRELAGLFAQVDGIARKGAFIALRMDSRHLDGPYQVSMGGPLFGTAYFDESGTDILPLMRDAISFWKDHRG
ncbi:hypothetical protein [Luteibacter sp. Lutesp34]|uniref:hypothetical protein n=1 Tax=Luteibacter sp. Lutesp34 TaxID=3243030 RepID=UPI0039B44DC7